MKVIIVNNSESLRNLQNLKDLQTLINKIVRYYSTKRIRNLKLLQQKKEVTIVFLTRIEMKKINLQFRNKNKPTDILSFQSEDINSLGELVLCIDVLKAQAKKQRHSLDAEVAYMLIHGILHLLGYDHEASAAEERRMFRLQDKGFSELV